MTTTIASWGYVIFVRKQDTVQIDVRGGSVTRAASVTKPTTEWLVSIFGPECIETFKNLCERVRNASSIKVRSKALKDWWVKE